MINPRSIDPISLPSRIIASPIDPATGAFSWVRACDFARYGDERWRADAATPIEWEYLLHQSGGKFGFERQDGFATQQEAIEAAEAAMERFRAL